MYFIIYNKMTEFQEICSLVGDFNYLFGVLKEPYNPNDEYIKTKYFNNRSADFNKIQYDLRYSLINEEVLELLDAYDKNDSIEIIDAMMDILYVVAGAKVYFNLPNGYINTSIYYISKSDNKKFNLESINNKLEINKELLNVFIEDIDINNARLKLLIDRIIKEYNFIEIERYNKYLDNIIQSLFEITYILDIDVMKYFHIVHSSNMSKICLNEQEAIESVQFYKNDENSRYKTPIYRQINYKDVDYFIVYDEDTKKILKSINYTKVEFI